jgi:biopolymer transport protein ExbD
MAYRSSTRPRGFRFNITPLIDVVFLLIIFFMAAAQFQEEEKDDVALPQAFKAETPKSSSASRLTLNVIKPGEVHIQGRVVPEPELADVIARAALKAGREPLAVKIRSDRDVRFGVIQSIMLACARANVWRVAFSVTPAKRGPSVPGGG